MNKSDTDITLVLITTILAILSFSYLFKNNKKRKVSLDLDEDGFETDRKNFQKDFNNIASDMKRAEKKLLNVRQ
ncbi:MAG: hypothetical protein ACPGTO_03475 [Polaribacter sp.]